MGRWKKVKKEEGEEEGGGGRERGRRKGEREEVPLFGVEIFGVSLSELHTSVTALRTCVYGCLLACLDRPLTINFK